MKKNLKILLIIILLVIAIFEGIFLVKENFKKEKESIPNTMDYSHIVHTIKVLYPDKTISFIQKRFYLLDEKDVCISSMSITYFYHEDVYLNLKNSFFVDYNDEDENSNCSFDDENMIITNTSKLKYNPENNKNIIESTLEPTSEYIITSSEIY